MEVCVSGAFLHSVLGLLPGATVTFRQCLRSPSASSHVHFRVIPLTSVTINALPSFVPSSQVVQDSPFTDAPTDTLAVRPTDHQDSSSDPSQPSTPPRCYYLSHLLSNPDSVSPTQTIVIHCHLQAIKSLVLKWSCQRCGHKDCVCSADIAELEGKLTSTARFAVEDGTGEALVWCSEPSAIAPVLGLTAPQWTQLELEMQRCKEVVYSYKKPDYREKAVMPSPTDTEGLVNLLCSHDSVQKPLVLHCQLMVWGNGKKNAMANTGIAGRQYAPSVHLKCLSAYEGYH
ncbi:uncharacterized protein LOC119745134 [Patiria miniata]|uniref:CST complex subunit CTC1 n=1 Tax=Patiria miniata TaxID=46514 RepID=A0A914BNJ2_PATMI|nr:uncharacterized protein LOC119745134 [Patiria miniata]